jgi:hypothetical protein
MQRIPEPVLPMVIYTICRNVDPDDFSLLYTFSCLVLNTYCRGGNLPFGSESSARRFLEDLVNVQSTIASKYPPEFHIGSRSITLVTSRPTKKGEPLRSFYVSPFTVFIFDYNLLSVISLPNQARYQAALLSDKSITSSIFFKMSRT